MWRWRRWFLHLSTTTTTPPPPPPPPPPPLPPFTLKAMELPHPPLQHCHSCLGRLESLSQQRREAGVTFSFFIYIYIYEYVHFSLVHRCLYLPPFYQHKKKGHSFPGDFCGNLRFVGKGTDGVSSVHFLFSSFLAISLATDVC